MALRLVLFSVALTSLGVAGATECDNITQRAEILKKKDALPIVNGLMGELVDSVIDEFPPQRISEMDLKDLSKEFCRLLQERTAPAYAPGSIPEPPVFMRPKGAAKVDDLFKGQFGVPFTVPEFAFGGREIPDDLVPDTSAKTKVLDHLRAFPFGEFGISVPLKESVYGELTGRQSGLAIMPGLFVASLHLGNQVIGSDKIGHFLAQGYRHFLDYSEGKTIPELLKQGKAWEETIMGQGLDKNPTFGSGVISYADITSNLAGFLFWYELWDGPNPYLKVRGGAIVRVREIRIESIPLSAWDEAINPNDYHERVRPVVMAHLARMGVTLPLDKTKCVSLATLPCAGLFLSPSCRELADTAPSSACPERAADLIRGLEEAASQGR